MNKKASETLEMWAVKLILVIIIALTLFYGVSKVSDNSIHVERVKVRDFALLYDVSTASQARLNIAYSIPQNYTLTLSHLCKIEIMENTKKLPSIFFCNQYYDNTKLIAQNKTYSIQKNV